MSRTIIFDTRDPNTQRTDHELCRALLQWSASDHCTNFKKYLSRATGVDASIRDSTWLVRVWLATRRI